MADAAMLSYFRITESDLEENRAGKISSSQKSAVVKSGLIALGVFALLGALLGAALYSIAIQSSKILAASLSLGIFSLVGLLFLSRALMAARDATALSITGKVSFVRVGKSVFMTIGGMKLPALAASIGLFKRDETYTVYYTRNKIILAAEKAG